MANGRRHDRSMFQVSSLGAVQCGGCWVPQCGDSGAVVVVPQAGHVPAACQELMCDTGGHWASWHVSWGGCEVEQHMGHRQ